MGPAMWNRKFNDSVALSTSLWIYGYWFDRMSGLLLAIPRLCPCAGAFPHCLFNKVFWTWYFYWITFNYLLKCLFFQLDKKKYMCLAPYYKRKAQTIIYSTKSTKHVWFKLIKQVCSVAYINDNKLHGTQTFNCFNQQLYFVDIRCWNGNTI